MRKRANANQRQLRIIGGTWRGRKLAFPDLPGLRPTPDRVRETVFNWLAPAVQDARCIDLFAGSGALGLEALSRGAAYCDFVDISRPATEAIGDHLAALGASGRASVHCCDAQSATLEAADLVFLDPPFDGQLLNTTLSWLSESSLLAKGALVYVEHRRGPSPPAVAKFSSIVKDKTAGEVRYCLLCR
ncbi:MAG: 16S rRNA (guanine(966)-N(2))-methyltransferase RsmD [Cellvibrionales bacterium]|jgi:16S rRNA (guanine966-N2)-methyltransferase